MEKLRSVLRVVSVDDDSRLLAAQRREAAVLGYSFQEATSVDEGLGTVIATSPDVVLVDLRIGSQSGIALVESVRASGFAGRIVLTSAYLTVAIAMEGVRAGACDVVVKPMPLVYMCDHGRLNKSHAAPALDVVEWHYISRVIQDVGGNLSEAARVLGIYRSTLKRKLAKNAPNYG